MLVPIGAVDSRAAIVNVPQATAVNRGWAPEVKNADRKVEASVSPEERVSRARGVGIYRPKAFRIVRDRLIPLKVTAISALVVPPTGTAVNTGFPPDVSIKDDGQIFVPLGLCFNTGYAPEVKADVPVPPQGAAPPYLMRRRRRQYRLPNGTVYFSEEEALFNLNRWLAEQAKKDQLTRPKDERPSLPAVSQEDDTEEIPEYLGGPSLTDLPALRLMQLQLEAQPPQSIDPQLLSVLLQRIDDEEAAMLLL